MSMNEAEVVGLLCRMAAEQVSVDPSAVTADSQFFSDLQFDSLDAVEFVMRIEEEFDVSVSDEAAEGIRTPREAYAVLAAAMSSGASEARGIAEGTAADSRPVE